MNTEAATGGLFFNKVAGLKETLAQLFSYEFCEIFKNILFAEHLRTTASRIIQFYREPPSIFQLKNLGLRLSLSKKIDQKIR